MTLYVTDNPIIKKDIPGSVLLYQQYDWRVLHDKEESTLEEDFFKIKKRAKSKNIKQSIEDSDHIVAIVAESNYKLQYEISLMNASFYKWHEFKTRIEYLPDYKKNKKLFHQYLQRGYFSRTIYDKLAALNMQRIEQLLVYIALYRYKAERLKGYSPEYTCRTDRLINALSCKRNDFWFIVDKLMRHSRKGDISDPFIGDFEFVNEKNSLYKIFKENENKAQTKMTKVYLYILHSLKNILPYTDILKTIRYMETNELISVKDSGIFMKLSKDKIQYAFDFLDEKKWEALYESNDFLFGIFPSLEFIKDLYFKCPVCGSTKLASSPVTFWCSNRSCSFKVSRLISPTGVAKAIAEKDLSRMLKFGDTVIKNKSGGYNRFFMLESEKAKGLYFLKPKIYKPIV